MTSSDVWDEETAGLYDEASAEKFAPEVLDPTVDFLARLVGSGCALELAIGTGRVGIPLAARGVPVTGVELSEPMVAQLRRKVDEAALPVVVGDMATTRVPGQFSLVYLVWNTIANLRTQEEQVECFRNAASHLSPGGRFVIELMVPPLRRLPPGQTAVPFDVREGHLGFDTYDLTTQRGTSHHYWLGDGGTTRYGLHNFRYIWPAECDLMARLAGLELEERFADWDGSPFTSDSESHVSVWRNP
ncbi:MAG: Methyltransferase SCO0408 [uncultured Nocardioidaceae bacterium]|uniref:Methyltransferase SCO0408 n=1 Tax=uncultured Nocardioidaceae bacterium TaxID=253824 RepID=A0A6J4N9N0_9ACTN|nr:MAG: Methyltransferase SCO0408 [uncultured Nocardioidaceae bacterium]